MIEDSLRADYGSITGPTKGGFERPGPGKWVTNGRPEYIRDAIEGSLKRLKRKQLDLWQLHRIDAKRPVVEAVKAGKIKHVGLSEVGIEDIERAEKVIPIVSVQNMYNLGERKWDEVVDYTARKNMAFIPWYPLASSPSSLQGKIGAMAEKYGATVAQIALAWLLKRSPNILLIPGTSSLEHLRENLAAGKIDLSDEDFLTLSA